MSIIVIVILIFFILLIMGMDIGFAMCIPSLIYIIFQGIPLSIIPQRLMQGLNSFPLLAIPLFIMTGTIMNTGGITNRIFKFANNAIGFIPGGLGHVNVVSSMIFAGMSGVAVADIGGIGQIEIKAMNDAKYPIKFSAGITAASAIVGPLIPPSIPFVMYSIVSDASILALFLAGIIPGFIVGFSLMIMVFIIAKRNRFPTTPIALLKDIFSSFVIAFPALIAPVLLIGGMLSGIFSPTEAAAVTVIYSLFVTMLVYKDLSFKQIPSIIFSILRTIARLTFIIASAVVFSWILVIEGTPQTLVKFFISISANKFILLILLDLLFLVLGCFVDISIVILLVTPIVIPVLEVFGISIIHFGVLIVFSMCIGMYTPPMGVALFMIQDICNISFIEAVRALLPFLIPLFLTLIVLTFLPDLTLILPSIFGYL